MESINFPDKASLYAYLGQDEISQERNLNSYTRLFRIPNALVAKIYVDNLEMARKNIVNLNYICELDRSSFPQGIILPKQWITLCGEIIGYTMRRIDGICLRDALDAPNVTSSIKCGWFDRAAEIVLGLPDGIYVGDLHGGNILITETNEVCFIDVDGFSVDKGYHLTCPFPKHMDLPTGKIMSSIYDVNGELVVSRYTDILCLVDLFLAQYLGRVNIFCSVYVDEYFRYLRSVFQEVGIANALILEFLYNGRVLGKNFFSDFLKIDCALLSFDVFLNATGLVEKERRADYILQAYIEGNSDE